MFPHINGFATYVQNIRNTVLFFNGFNCSWRRKVLVPQLYFLNIQGNLTQRKFRNFDRDDTLQSNAQVQMVVHLPYSRCFLVLYSMQSFSILICIRGITTPHVLYFKWNMICSNELWPVYEILEKKNFPEKICRKVDAETSSIVFVKKESEEVCMLILAYILS